MSVEKYRDFLDYWDSRFDENEKILNNYPQLANFAFRECNKVWNMLIHDYAALLARHNALEKDHNVSLMLLAREREQRDALLRLRDTDEWRSGVAIGGYIVSKAVAESELKTLKDRHAALREAVAWERSAMRVFNGSCMPGAGYGEFTWAAENLEKARAEVDRLIGEEE